MERLHESLIIPVDLLTNNLVSLVSKATEFAATGATCMHAVFDFDRTLTVKKLGTQDEVTTWHILREHLPKDGQLEYQQLFNKYRPLELNGRMTQQDATEWWSSILNLFVTHKVNLTKVEETFLDRANIRPGTIELFDLLADNNIPTVILSAGIREVIDIWCRKYEIKPSLVVSTALILDDENRITGWQKETLVHALNKSEATHPELASIRAKRPNTLLVGDGIDDADMVTNGHNAIRVRVLDPRSDEASTKQEEAKTFTRFDALIKSGSLDPIGELIKAIV